MSFRSGHTPDNKKRAGQYNHAEAFCLMTYAPVIRGSGRSKTRTGDPTVTIWNSRDGVTPFGVTINDQEHIHVNWQNDRQVVDYIPAVDDYVFVDLTRERFEECQQAMIEKYWDHPATPMSRTFKTKEIALARLMEGFEQGQPDMIHVTQEWLDEFLQRREHGGAGSPETQAGRQS